MNPHPGDLAPFTASAQSNAPVLAPPSTPATPALPRSVLFVALIVIAFIGLLTLEISDSFFRHEHQIARSLFVLPIPVALLWGLLARRRWAWWATRAIALLAAILYTLPSIGIWFFFPHLPFGMRLWITIVSALLFALALSACLTLGRGSARAYFRDAARLKTEH